MLIYKNPIGGIEMGRNPKCKYCKRVVKSTSNHGLCAACSVRKCKTVVRQMRKKKGKYYKSWKVNLLNAIKKQGGNRRIEVYRFNYMLGDTMQKKLLSFVCMATLMGNSILFAESMPAMLRQRARDKTFKGGVKMIGGGLEFLWAVQCWYAIIDVCKPHDGCGCGCEALALPYMLGPTISTTGLAGFFFRSAWKDFQEAGRLEREAATKEQANQAKN